MTKRPVIKYEFDNLELDLGLKVQADSPSFAKDTTVKVCTARSSLFQEVKLLNREFALVGLQANVIHTNQVPATGKIVLIGPYTDGFGGIPSTRLIKEPNRWVVKMPMMVPPYGENWMQTFSVSSRAARIIALNMAGLPYPWPEAYGRKRVRSKEMIHWLDSIDPKADPLIWVDIETTSLYPREGEIFCIGMWMDGDPVVRVVYGVEDSTHVASRLQYYPFRLGACNLQFEQGWAWHKFNALWNLTEDVQVDFALLYEERMKGLEHIAGLCGMHGYDMPMEEWLNPVQGKKMVAVAERRQHKDAPIELMIPYNAGDNLVAGLASKVMKPILASHPGNQEEVRSWLVRGQTMLALVKDRGIKVDKGIMLKVCKDAEENMAKAKEVIDAKARKHGYPDGLNLKSAPQKKELLYDKIGYPVMHLTQRPPGLFTRDWVHPDEYNVNWNKGWPDVQPSTGTDALELIQLKVGEDPFLKAMIEYNQLQALVDGVFNRSKQAVLGGDGFLRSDYNLTSLVTGQISSTNPPMQNVVKDPSRRMYVSRFKGGFITELDQNQLHMRIIGNLAQCLGFISAYKDDVDMHLRTAAQVVMNMREEQVLALIKKGDKKAEEARDITGKRTNFSVIFEIGGNSLAFNIRKTPAYCKMLINKWFGVFPEIQEQIDRQHAFATKHGYVISPFGRVRHLPGAQHPDRNIRYRAERQAGDYLVSNAGRYVTLYGAIEMDEYMRNFGMESCIVGTVHDSIIVDTHPDEKDDVLDVADKYWLKFMSSYCADWMQPIPFVIDGFQGPNWWKKDKVREVRLK